MIDLTRHSENICNHLACCKRELSALAGALSLSGDVQCGRAQDGAAAGARASEAARNRYGRDQAAVSERGGAMHGGLEILRSTYQGEERSA